MQPRWMSGLSLLLLTLVLAACTSAASPTATPTSEPTKPAAKALVLGDISDDPTKTISAFQPLADYLAAGLSQYGITEGQVKAAPDLDTMGKWMKSGDVDVYFDSPYPAMIVIDASGAKPILRRWKGGVEQYHSVILASATSGIKSLEDLKGHIIGFEDNFSTSAYMLPRAYLAEAGLKTVEKSSTDAQVANDEVGYAFSGDDANTIQWVLSGKVPAGAIASTAYQDIPESDRKNLVVLKETEELPRHLVLVRGSMDASMVDTIKTLLVGLDKTDNGKAILKTFEKTARFDEFPNGADATLKRVNELYQLVQSG